MTPQQITLVQNSFAQVARISDQAAALFYARLFELDPSLRPMFRGDLQQQGRKLMQMLALAVGSLERLDSILPAVRAMGVRHAGYGVKEDHYATVGAALLWTLEQGLGPDFRPETRAAWVEVYMFIAREMTGAARNAHAA